jgi:mRNA interferase MazF
MRPGPVARGDVWQIDFGSTVGHEQAGVRPGLILSAGIFNEGPAGLVIAIPMTTRDKGISTHVKLDPPEGGLDAASYAKCEEIRSISKERLLRRRGRVSAATLRAIGVRVLDLLDL